MKAAVHILVSLLMLAGAFYILLSVLLFFMQSKLLYYPDMGGRELRRSPADIGLDYREVTIVTDDQVKLHGWFVPAGQQRGFLLFFHGNAGNISHRLDSLRIFHSLGLSTLIIDYRGYGQSEGRTSERGTYRDAEAAWRYLVREQKADPAEIIVFGRSLGGAVAANLAARHPPAGLILESVFTSVPDLAAHYYPYLPVRLLSRFRYDAWESVKKAASPVLVIHSPDDEIIPYIFGRKVFAAAPEPKIFLPIRGGHNEGFLATGPEYVLGLERFVVSVLENNEKKMKDDAVR